MPRDIAMWFKVAGSDEPPDENDIVRWLDKRGEKIPGRRDMAGFVKLVQDEFKDL